MNALDRLEAALVEHGCNPKRRGDRVDALCPAHDDSRPSLSADDGGDRALVTCHAGCRTEDVLSALGLMARDLFDEPSEKVVSAPRIAATYDYVDEAGTRLYQVVRFEPKTFRQRRPDGGGGWVWKLGDVRRVPYRLPELIDAVSAGNTVFIVEGEKDVESIRKRGDAATCNAGGAGKWTSSYSEYLRGADAVVIADRDEPGRAHARQVADSLRGLAALVRIVEPRQGKDVSDHLAAGLGLEDLEDSADSGAPASETEAAPLRAPGREECAQYEETDLGNARRLVAKHGGDLRYVPEWGKWLCWTDTYWKVDVTGEVNRRAKQVTETILDEARAGADGLLFRWGLKSQSAGAMNNMITVASTEPTIPVLVDQLDADPWLLTVANGTVDLRTCELHPPERDHLITKSSSVNFDPDACCPRFDAFLEQILPDPEIRAFLQRCAGYALTGEVLEQVLIILYGLGGNGKSIFKEMMLELLGEHAKPAAPKLLLATNHDEHPTAIADLHGRRLVVSHEVEDGLRLDEALVKELTGGDRLKARYMRQDYWDFAPTHKLWMACNHKPKIRGTDNGIWRRIRLVPFEVTIPDEQQDKHLLDKLRAELPGVLLWALEGCRAWQEEGLNPPKAVLDSTARYRLESDLLAQYIDERLVDGDTHQVRSTDLYADYKAWCQDNGLDHPLTQKAVARQLDERGYDRTENRSHQIIWIGLGLASLREEQDGAASR